MYQVIFVHHPKKGMENEFIAQWQKGSDVIQSYKGALGTKLFKSLQDPEVYYAIAAWESKDARDKAIAQIRERADAQEILKAHENFVNKVSVLDDMELVGESLPK